MNQERLMQVLLAPLVSEKTSIVAEQCNQVAFRVRRDASKQEVKAAVEQLFDVEVLAVTTSNVKSKRKRFGRLQGKRAAWKKAYVRLAAGQDIDLVSGS